MKRFILTGAPGSGKTSILRQLALEGFNVMEEAATDVIALEQSQGVAEPWRQAAFIDKIVALQSSDGIALRFSKAKFNFMIGRFSALPHWPRTSDILPRKCSRRIGAYSLRKDLSKRSFLHSESGFHHSYRC